MGKLPLYQSAQELFEKGQGNWGLRFDKFFDGWTVFGEDWTVGEKEKKDWLDTHSQSVVGEEILLKEYWDRRKALVEARQGQCLFVKNQGRFAAGMGRSHPLENGLAWQHTLGVPYLSASSLKGLTHAWAKAWLDVAGEEIARIFGTTEGEGAAAGTVIFFELLPGKPVKLEADVMTPHYGDYYTESKGENPPADWYNPVPIAFMTVSAGQRFMTAVAPRCPAQEGHRQDADTAMSWLKQALALLGAGGKTAAGYGRFVVDEELQSAWQRMGAEKASAAKASELAAEREQQLAKLTPLTRAMMEDGYQQEDFLHKAMNHWIEKMNQAERAERQEIAQLLGAWYQKYKAQDWAKPGKANAKNKEKIKAIQQALEEGEA